ncbi:Subtilisin-like protease [Euphorbia peplus]|nr:Subtilisin-like protease [Euphorbia peplus]
MGGRPTGEFTASVLHSSILQQVVGSGASDYLLHSYHRSFNGFAAMLTEEERQKLAGTEGVVSVFLSEKKELHTTRSWNFMNFPINTARSTNEGNVIVGMLDTGIWPESQSFNGKRFGPPPPKWKGVCQGNSNFTCNNKIIGARYYHADRKFYPEEFVSPRDSDGHGTHTASTVAGDVVRQASLLGLASGTARGGVPSARIAVYKICWLDGCWDVDILAAFDDAIADGVDIISLSVGGYRPMDYFEDSIAIGAFHAMKNGILTSNSAGNSGPRPMSISSYAPWSLLVGASTIDRKFVTKLKLGNGAIYEGVSINTFSLRKTMYQIIYAGNAPNRAAGHTGSTSRFCGPGSLNQTLVKGKIVVCDDRRFYSPYALSVGVIGIVSNLRLHSDGASRDTLPVTLISSTNKIDVLRYLISTSKPKATIFKSAENKDQFAPSVASFSSRGPNPITHDILKPDLTAPGVDILASWSEAVMASELDNRVVPYNIISGTSMSCPHASGAAAYVKSFHPIWSPAAIKSALMTTAYPMSSSKNMDAEFAYGSGHINPAMAIRPGLVYDAGELDYVKFLCGQGYNRTQLQIVTGDSSTCSKQTKGTVWDLNYPSFAVSVLPRENVTRKFHRTVTNVGSPKSTYKAVIDAPPGLYIQVQPDVLSFTFLGQKKNFIVTVESNAIEQNPVSSGVLIWDDGMHQVRSPIVGCIYKPLS